ncbi:MAG: hypothetical protein ACRD6N_00580 [Pyrinomonadaceae bacterium]
MKLFWMIVAGVAIVVAAVFLWLGDFNKAFVAAAIGLVAWFLNYRMQIKQQLDKDEREQNKKADSEELDEH